MLNKILRPIKYFIKRYADFCFFCIFVITIPFEKRHIFNLSDASLNNHFIEWKAYSLYLSDIIFILVILFWLLRICLIRLDSVKHAYPLQFQRLKPNYTIYILVAFIFIALVSLLGSQALDISFYRTIKLFEFCTLFLFIYKTVNSYFRIFIVMSAYIFSAFIQSLIAIIQFLTQKSVGLSFLGEPTISPDTLNVAKIVIYGENVIRSYGTMPHANILGGYLFIALLFCISIILVFPLFQLNSENVPRGTFFKKKSSRILNNKLFHVEQFPYLFILSPKVIFSLVFFAFTVICFAFVLSFSYSAYLALFLGVTLYFVLIAFLFIRNKHDLKIKLSKICKYSNYYILLIIFIIFVAFLTFLPEITAKFTNIENVDSFTVQGRVEYVKSAIDIMTKYPEFGSGLGTFSLMLNSQQGSGNIIPYWQLNPVHNVLLLIGAELGITCLLLFILLFGYTIARPTINLYQANIVRFILLSTFIIAFIGIFIIMQLDHYFWTIQQGALALFLVLGILTTLDAKVNKI